MTDAAPNLSPGHSPFAQPEAVRRLKQRHAAERRFRFYGVAAIGFSVLALLVLLTTIGQQARSAFTRHVIAFDLDLDAARLAPQGVEAPAAIAGNVSGFNQLVQDALRTRFPHHADQLNLRRELYGLVPRLGVLAMAQQVAEHPEWIGSKRRLRVVLSDDLDLFLKGGITERMQLKLTPESRLSRLETGDFRLQDLSGQRFSALHAARDTRAGGWPTILIRAQDSWFTLLDAGADELQLRHLAGPRPDERVQIAGYVTALLISTPESDRTISDHQIAWTLLLQAQGDIQRVPNLSLLTHADSTYPELAGAGAAIAGSLLTMLVTALFAIPVGILAALYLEEFAPRNRLTGLIEVNINNLAAVPSIIFGLLGAAVFLKAFGMPRSVPFVGGLVLGLLVLPTVIIASRAALRAVPLSVRTAALGLGASKTQTVFHHTLPLAMPGIMTGAIIAMARALGETAPLLMIGMVAFVNDIPAGPGDESTVLPVLIYKWFSGAERAWEPMTSAVILVLLSILITMNLAAVLMRRHFEKRW